MEEQEKNKEREQRIAEKWEFHQRFFPTYPWERNLFQFDEELEEVRKMEEEEQKLKNQKTV